MEENKVNENEVDLNEYRRNTAEKASIQIIKEVAVLENIQDLFISKDDEESMNKVNEVYGILFGKIQVIMHQNNVALTDVGYMFTAINAIFDALKNFLLNKQSGIKHEILSRLVGAKNPKDGKFDIDYATQVQIIDSLLKLREQQGNDNEDYFTLKKDSPNEPSEPQAQPSPYVE
jgi:hypothetical protein